jgi:polyisoprenoid-binding protein YceI
MKKLLYTILFLCTGITASHAQEYMTDSGTAIFHSEVPLHSFSGTSNFLTGLINLEDGTVDFYLDLTTLDTGIEKRDRDMKETLETEKFPFAEFFGSLSSEFNPDDSSEQSVKVKGDFKIHGVSREVEIEGTLQKKPDGILLKANWVLLLEDYDIIPPKLLFVKVDQEQKIEIEALLKPTDN